MSRRILKGANKLKNIAIPSIEPKTKLEVDQKLETIKNRFNEQLKSSSEQQIITFFNEEMSDNLIMKTNLANIGFNRKYFLKQSLKLKKVAASLQAFSLSANQIGQQQRFFVMKKTAQNTQIDIQDYDVLFNPKIIEIQNITDSEKKQVQCSQNNITKSQIYDNKLIVYNWEECLSIPFFRFLVPRYNAIHLQYKDINNKVKVQRFSGKKSIQIQHNLDHLMGRNILNWRMHFGQYQLTDSRLKPYIPKSFDILTQNHQRIKQILKEYPNLKRIMKLQQLNEGGFVGQNLSFEQDFYYRFTKHFKKQLDIFTEKLQQGNIIL